MDTEEEQSAGYVFLPCKEETLLGRIRLRYSSSIDAYFQGTSEEFTNRPKVIGSSFKDLVYDHENIHQVKDEVTGKVYLDRQSKNGNGRITWRFNFLPCGLVLDRLTIKMSYNEGNGGQVIVSVSGDSGSKSASYCSSDVYMTITRLEGSSTLFLTANLNGENDKEITHLMTEQYNDQNYIDYPFDLQIRLKRPDFTIGRSLIFIGLMYSEKEPLSYQNKTKKKIKETNKGFLQILIHKAKRLPCRENGAYAEPKVKCTIYGNGSPQKVKTRSIGKTLNPTWNERLIIPNIIYEKLPYSQLELQVTHSKSMFKLKSKETLGYVALQRQNVIGTWQKPICRNHSVKRAEGRPNQSKKISSVSHQFTSTENLDANETNELQGNQGTPFKDDSNCVEKVKQDGENFVITSSEVLSNTNVLTEYATQKNFQPDIPNFQLLKESSVDEEDLLTSTPVDENCEAEKLEVQSTFENCNQLRNETLPISTGLQNSEIASADKDQRNNTERFDEVLNLDETYESDIVNITFRDNAVQTLLNRTISQKTTSSADESFEILSQFDGDEIKADVVKIENTIDESHVDTDEYVNKANTLTSKLDLADEKEDCKCVFEKTSEALHTNRDETNFLDSQKDNLPITQDSLDNFNVDDVTAESSGTVSPENKESLDSSLYKSTLNNAVDLSCTLEDDNDLESKRRAVSVDNSQLTPSRTRRYEVKNKDVSKNNTKISLKTKMSHSMSDLLDINKKRNKKFNKRKRYSSKLYRSGSVSNILDDFFEEKAKTLSEEHWTMMISTPDQWFYCWHPLLGVNNLLSNWQ